MPRRLGSFACLAFIAALSVALPALAQDAATLLEAKDTKPAAIPLTEVPVRADRDEHYARDVILLARDFDPVAHLGPRLDEIARSVDMKSRLFRGNELARQPVLRLESLNRSWNFDARRFAIAQREIREAGRPLAEAAAQLAKRRADWDATLKATPADSLTPALANRIRAVMALLDRAEQALSAPFEKQLRLGRRADALDSRIRSGQASVVAVIGRIDRRLLHIDALPIWAMRTRPADDAESTLQSIRTGLQAETRFLHEYTSADFGNQRALRVLQVLLLLLLVWLSLRARGSQPAGPLHEASTRVLRRPLSSWLLLSMMGVLAFEPEAPLLLHQIAMLVALVPVLRLLPPDAFRLLGPWPYVATGLYLLARLGFLFVVDPLLYRCYSLGLSVLATALMLWLLLRSRHRDPLHTLGWAGSGVRWIAWASVVLLAVAGIANVFGNVSLAETLTGGVIDSGYVGLALYASVTVFVALLKLLLTHLGAAHFQVSREHATAFLHRARRLMIFGAIVGWLVFTAIRFRIYRPVYSALESILTRDFTLGALSISLGDVLVFVVAVLIAFWAAGSVRYLLRDQLLPKLSLPRGVGNSIASLSYYAMLLLGLLAGLTAAGFKVSQLAFVFGALGVGIGFGLQNVVNNFVSGLILMFERPIQPGDAVEVAGTSGTVREIGIRATIIRTADGADVVVPNGTLLSEKLSNWTLMDRHRRIDIALGVAYGSDPAQVIALVTETITDTEQVARYPEPTVQFVGFGASSMDFAVHAWTQEYDYTAAIRSDLLARIYAALTKAGIEIPLPQQGLHLHTVSKDAARTLKLGGADAPPADGAS